MFAQYFNSVSNLSHFQPPIVYHGKVIWTVWMIFTTNAWIATLANILKLPQLHVFDAYIFSETDISEWVSRSYVPLDISIQLGPLLPNVSMPAMEKHLCEPSCKPGNVCGNIWICTLEGQSCLFRMTGWYPGGIPLNDNAKETVLALITKVIC